jgi:putative transposase
VKDEIERDRREKDLYAEIGHLKMEFDWLKKKLSRSGTEERRGMIEPKHQKLSVVRQCELLELPRSTFYQRPEPESGDNLVFMRVIDKTYLPYPFFGSRQMTWWSQRQGHRVNRKRCAG